MAGDQTSGLPDKVERQRDKQEMDKRKGYFMQNLLISPPIM